MNDYEKKIKEVWERKGFRIFHKGWPDFLCYHPKRNTAYCMEIKRNGDSVTKEQREMHKMLKSLHVPTYILTEDFFNEFHGRKVLTSEEASVKLLQVKLLEARIDEMKTELEEVKTSLHDCVKIPDGEVV